MEFEDEISQQDCSQGADSELSNVDEEQEEEKEQDPDVPGPSGLQQHNRSNFKGRPVVVGKKEVVEQKLEKTNSLSEILDGELLKARIGLGSDAILKELLTKLETERANKEPVSGKQLKEDGLTLKKFSQLAIYKIAGLSDENSSIVNPALMAQKLKDCFEEDNCEQLPAFSLIGKNLGNLLRKTPIHTYVRPCLAFNQTQNVRFKKERVKKEKAIMQTQVIRGKSTKQIHETAKDENSITKELDNVRRHLKAAWKQSDSNQVSYYPFVLHPSSFGETVENMFYVSFLIKDGVVGLKVNVETHMPTIVKISSAERARRDMMDRSSWDTTQVLTNMTHSIWQGLVKKIGVTKPMIVR